MRRNEGDFPRFHNQFVGRRATGCFSSPISRDSPGGGWQNACVANPDALPPLLLCQPITAKESSMAIDIQTFSSPGNNTWNKPANAKWVRVILFGAGGGGGGGPGRAAGF